jgi:hypothetical protein
MVREREVFNGTKVKTQVGRAVGPRTAPQVAEGSISDRFGPFPRVAALVERAVGPRCQGVGADVYIVVPIHETR